MSIGISRFDSRTAAALSAFALTAGWRVLTFSGYQNDHYVHLARAQQVILGDLPIRDFVDPGMPAQYLVSAAAWALLGGSQGTELVLTAAAFGLAAALTALVVHRLTASVPLALGAAFLEVLMFPRTYSYPKVLLYAAAACAIVAVVVSPSRRRLLLAALVTALAFLFRHDHGIYIGLATAVAAALASLRDGWRAAARRAAACTAVAVLLVTPWLGFVSYHQGLAAYVRSGLEFSRAEAERNGGFLRFPPLDLSGVDVAWFAPPYRPQPDAYVWLFYVFRLIPLVCAGLAWRRAHTQTPRWPGESAAIGSLAVLAMLTNIGLLRGDLVVWLPDAVTAPVILGAWLTQALWRGGPLPGGLRVGMRVLLCALIAVTTVAVARAGDLDSRIERSSVDAGLGGIVERLGELQARVWLPQRDAGNTPSGVSNALPVFFEYVIRCTNRDDRLLMTQLYPDVFVLAERGFAGGHVAFLEGFYTSRAEQERTLYRLRREQVPFVLLLREREDLFRDNFDLLNAYVESRYMLLTEFPVEDDDAVRVFVDTERPAVGTDAETGWPCFSRREPTR